VPWRVPTNVQHPCALWASRPQLKRDPLGGALPPHRHLLVNSFGSVNTRGAELGCSQASPGSPRPTPHGRAYRDAAPRASFRRGGLPIVKFSTQGGAAAQPRAARSSLGAKRAV